MKNITSHHSTILVFVIVFFSWPLSVESLCQSPIQLSHGLTTTCASSFVDLSVAPSNNDFVSSATNKGNDSTSSHSRIAATQRRQPIRTLPAAAPDTEDELWASLFGSAASRDVFFAHHYQTCTVYIQRSLTELSLPLPQNSFCLSTLYHACEFINLRHRGSCDRLDKSRMNVAYLEAFIERGGSAVLSVVDGVEPEAITTEYHKFKEKLEAFFGHSLSFNIYHSGPNGTALMPHYDSYDVFVVQLQGEKTWDIVLGDKEQPYALTLRPGDLLYMPQGVVHSAKTASGFSSTTHLTIGIEKPR